MKSSAPRLITKYAPCRPPPFEWCWTFARVVLLYDFVKIGRHPPAPGIIIPRENHPPPPPTFGVSIRYNIRRGETKSSVLNITFVHSSMKLVPRRTEERRARHRKWRKSKLNNGTRTGAASAVGWVLFEWSKIIVNYSAVASNLNCPC